MPPISRQLTEWCAKVQLADISSEMRALTPLRLLDTTGLVIAGSATKAANAARAVAENFGGLEECTVVGLGRRLPSASAVLVHGIAAHCHDFDDTFVESVVHPGSVVVPTALAISEALDADHQDFEVAIAIGYELAARIGAVAGRRFHTREMHATGIVGPLVAAAVASRLRRLEPERISWAIGLAASMSGGLRAYAKDGGWSKWLHVGWAAHGGILAAEFAAQGFRGPEYVLDGGSDLYSVMLHGDELDRSVLLTDLGKLWKGAAAEFKSYPCAHVIHPFIDALLAIVREYDLPAAAIDGIECSIAPWAASIVCEPVAAKLRFSTELEAIGSLPYQLAAAALDRRVSLNTLHEDNRRRADIAALAQRVTHRKDPSLGRRFDGRIEVRTTSGQLYARSAVLAPNDVDALQDKFIGLAEPVLGREAACAASAQLLQPAADWRSAVSVLRAVTATPTRMH